MAKTMKNLLRISMAIRNLGTLTGRTVTKRFFQTAGSWNTRYNKDALVSPQPHLASLNHWQEPLFKYCADHSEIFSIVRSSELQMKGSDAAAALHELFKVDKKNGQKTERIYEHEDFLLLCDILNARIRELSVTDAILAMKSFVHFGVPTTSVIVQKVLQLIRHSVNELTIKQIEFLDFLFQKCEPTPIIDALNVAMTIVYERDISMQLDRHNIKAIATAIKYLCKKSENVEAFEILFHAMKNCKQAIDVPTAKSVLWSLFYIHCDPPGLPDLLNDLLSIVARNIPNENRDYIKILMKNIATRTRTRGQHYYHEGLVDAVASTVISEDWGFSDAVNVLTKLIILGHTQIFLLDYIAAKCFEDPTIFESGSRSTIANVITGFAHADYKPVFWDVIKEHFMRTLETAAAIDYPQTKLVVQLITLDCYCPKLVEKVFTLYADTTPDRWQTRSRLLLLYQAIKTLYPQYSGPWPSAECIDIPPPRIMETSEDFPLLETLESALGGRRYVLTNVRSSLGHVIDHALVMRKGGFPVAINNEAIPEIDTHPIRQLNDLQPPADAQVILLLLIPEQGYSVNSQRMKGSWTLQIRTLEALTGYTVIPIQRPMWTSLPACEKIPYLMQAIRLKCDEMSLLATP